MPRCPRPWARRRWPCTAGPSTSEGELAMRVDVTMPQMGESIAEGTITRWMKAIGETVGRDEPLFEISTDKVDAEIPSPAAGTLVEVKHKEGETVPVNQVVGVLETEAGAAASAPAPPSSKAPEVQQSKAPRPDEPIVPGAPKAPAPYAAKPAQGSAQPVASGDGGGFVSPVVRKIAAEHGIDPARVSGTGAGGRVTKKDILDFIEKGGKAGAAAPAPSRPQAAPAPAPAPRPLEAPGAASGERVERVQMTQMRKRIAEHMIESRRTSAHVHSVFEIDVTHMMKLRQQFKAVYEERHGVKLTVTPFVVRAIVPALRAFPVVNSSVEGEEIVYKKDINVGIAVALDWGLIVPVVRSADELSMAGLARRINDLADRARTKKLNPDEVQGGTFTITNPGIFGGLYGLPIINQPQVAILGMGGIQKRPVVVDGDAIAIRQMMYVSMSYDHRVVDGAVADQFLAMVKKNLETFDEAQL
ncbi:MAG TPA: 2-oxoglutarate dehydrogenase, E2 component, dihydrolipoamide succinyltransferase [Candidatus Polarisedimenticolaceae bacterium]|nr:2-oxoglutarate dehydrogenase, E2 component, dihydrolipoamide succinyltransferase [Candidatus Polarisedimenticolaceae bacterium]